ncbi:DUF805 domain-containing protein [Paracoccus sp. (in: a-proteobacteria)]|uniref:DUF805 domain-containing protein n=1 Tax=Paracoccus sp. TaxID=267 RepID=UPI0028971C80|nr:DUF805 domain-containing protein [Paracoccus sp. (in: a-proteobacteria)]
MNMFQAVGNCFSNYVTFSGRATRSEYWWFTLFNLLAGFVLGMVQAAMGLQFGLADLYALAAILPGVAVTSRRLHDVGRSGWWQLLIFVPLIGAIVLLVWLVSKGEYGTNSWGEDPLAAHREPALA